MTQPLQSISTPALARKMMEFFFRATGALMGIIGLVVAFGVIAAPFMQSDRQGDVVVATLLSLALLVFAAFFIYAGYLAVFKYSPSAIAWVVGIIYLLLIFEMLRFVSGGDFKNNYRLALTIVTLVIILKFSRRIYRLIMQSMLSILFPTNATEQIS